VSIVTNLSIVSFDGHNINDGTSYEAGVRPGSEWGLPNVGANLVARHGRHPLVSGIERSGREIRFIVRIVNSSSVYTLRDQLLRWFDPEDETPKTFIIEDSDGSKDRYVSAICTSCLPLVGDVAAVAEAFLVSLIVHGDVRWRSTSTSTTVWGVTASGQTTTVSNAGTDDAYPTITVKPTAAKSGSGYIYRRFVAIRWRVSAAFSNYPTDVCDDSLDTDALVETATTTTLNGALAQAAATITLASAASFPTSGMAYITDGVNGDEQVSWTGKSGNDLTGVTRGIGGTSDVNHLDGDTVALSKMLANGADLRVEVDGTEVDRWLDGMDTATTKAWVNLNWSAAWAGTITSGIGAGDTVTSITVNEATTGAPSTGILCVNSEYFTYTSKSDATKTFSGVTRAAKGSSAGAHSASDACWWVQHDIWLKYGNYAASAPSVDSDYEPAFELDHSTNTSWVYEEFGEDDGLRTGQWTQSVISGSPTFYGGNRGAGADPWVEIGIDPAYDHAGRLQLYNPCGFTNVNFSNGEKYAEETGHWSSAVQSSTNGSNWTTEYAIPAPAGASNWEAWSDNEALTTGSLYIALSLLQGWSVANYRTWVEAADCTMTLNSSNTPAVTIGSESTPAYNLACTVTNNTTSKAIELAYQMDVNDSIEVDTDAKTVTDKGDESSQFQALTLTGGPRRDWLKLDPGNNTIQFDDTGTTGVTVTVAYIARYY